MWLRLAWREMSRRKTRAALSIVGVGLCVTLLVSTLTITRAVERAFLVPMAQAGADIVVQKHGPPCTWKIVKLTGSLAPIPESSLQALRGISGVIEVAGSLQLWAFPAGADGQPIKDHPPTVVTGIDIGYPAIGPVKPTTKKDACCEVSPGRVLDSNERPDALVTVEFAEGNKLSIGSTLRLGKEDFSVIGMINPGKLARIAGAEAFVPLPQAQRLLGEGAVVDTAYLKLKAEADPKDVEQRIKDILGSEVTVTTSTHLIQQAAGMDVLQRSTTQALVAILFALVLLLVVKTSIASVYERAREIGILRAVGWTSGEVRRLLLIEHVMQGAIALVAGLVLGLGIACAYARVVELKIPDALNKYPSCASTKAPVSIPEVIVRFEPDVLLLALVLSLGIALVSAGIAARRITRMYPAEALRQL